jgi:ribosomal protein S12 methylthiotransferase accessory factor
MISGRRVGDPSDEELKPHLERMMRLVDPQVGIITNVFAQFREADDPLIFNATAVLTNNERYAEGQGSANAVQGNGGAGLTLTRCLIGAIGEALERYGCSIIDRDRQVFGSSNNLRARNIPHIDPETIALFSEGQYADPNFPYKRLSRNSFLSWTDCDDLNEESKKYVPSSLLYLPYRSRDPNETINFAPTLSTGQATGPSLAAATLTGLLEAIERDAYVITWLGKLQCPVLEINSSELVSGVIRERFSCCPMDIVLNLITLDVQVPVVIATGVDRSNPSITCTLGVAAHPNPEIAAVKALIELAQDRFYVKYLARTKERISADIDYREINDFEKRVVFFLNPEASEYFSFLRNSPRSIRFDEAPSLGAQDAAGLVRIISRMVKNAGGTVLRADLTPADLASVGLYVVKTLIPEFQELEGDHNVRFLGCNRLYEVPATLGYADAPRRDVEVNPVPHPLP